MVHPDSAPHYGKGFWAAAQAGRHRAKDALCHEEKQVAGSPTKSPCSIVCANLCIYIYI